MPLYTRNLSSPPHVQFSVTLYHSLLHCKAGAKSRLRPEVQTKSCLTITPCSALLHHIINSFTPDTHIAPSFSRTGSKSCSEAGSVIRFQSGLKLDQNQICVPVPRYGRNSLLRVVGYQEGHMHWLMSGVTYVAAGDYSGPLTAGSQSGKQSTSSPKAYCGQNILKNLPQLLCYPVLRPVYAPIWYIRR